MKFYGFWLLLILIFCITIAVGRNIDCTQNAFLKSKSIACRGRGGGWMGGNNGGGGGNNGGEEGSGTNGDAASGATGAMTNMAPALMRTAQQAMGTMMDMMSNMNPMG